MYLQRIEQSEELPEILSVLPRNCFYQVQTCPHQIEMLVEIVAYVVSIQTIVCNMSYVLSAYREIDPAFSKRITKIFSSFLCSSSYKSTTDPPETSSPSLPPSLPPPSPSDSPEFPQLVPLTHFIRNPKAPCTTYRPLPPLYHIQQDVDEGQLSHAMRFVLSVMCQLIDVQLRTMYTTLLTVEKAFTKGIVVILKNLTYDFLNS